MGRVENKVALVTGAARGQGRSHAVRLAEEGADIIALDMCRSIDSIPYPLATEDDLQETGRLVEKLGRRVHTVRADVRDMDELAAAVTAGVENLGGLDIAIANAGIMSLGSAMDLSEAAWRDVIDVNLTGVWHTAKAAVPHLRARGSGSIVLTSSAMGFRPSYNLVHYTAAKHGVVGVMKNLALELGAEGIRVNAVLPTGVDTDMIHNEACYAKFAPDLEPHERTREAISPRFEPLTMLGIPWVEPIDVANAALWLSSSEARYVTGVALPVDGGQTAQ